MTDHARIYGLPPRMGSLPRTAANLCDAWNAYTDPAAYRSDHEHRRAYQAERAINRMMQRDGIRYREFSNGMRWPLREDGGLL